MFVAFQWLAAAKSGNLLKRSMKDAIIHIQALHIWYSSLHAVKNVSAEIPRHHITALIGASGSGKSSFLRCINRMLDHIPNIQILGEIKLHGTNNILDPETDVVNLRRKVGMVFQNPTPFPKSIYDNVAYGLEIQGIKKKRRKKWWQMAAKASHYRGIEASDDHIDRAVVMSLKEASLWEEVKDRLHQSAYRLSGGQQQRLCIARAIAVRPDILLLDEPCSDLDPISTRHIEELLLSLKKNYTIMIVTHNMHQAKRVADYVGFFHSGELIEFGKTAQIFDQPEKQLTREYVQGAFG